MLLHRARRRRRQRGFGLIVALVLMAVMGAYVATNLAALGRLRGFLSLVETQQVQRLRSP
ncbi:MAG TPA: hypothetical protein PLE19_22485 [Planctomycetota bacterium]|nr:hypothetical protein [Planctomycetota bacterium]HRR82685.1 hypothetical protein [Planctomycetota bacterium]HRT93924.1 hypothetical protein [Planctomycetota bacterium]